jgi:recombination protein RecT
MAEKETKAIAINPTKEIQENMNKWISDMVNTKQVRFPANYSPENALKAAMFILADARTSEKNGNKPVLEYCTKGSVYFALQKMLTNGLNPAKNQCYFIPYGTKMDLFISYFGYVGIAKSAAGIKEVSAQMIYKGDEFEYTVERGKIKILKHNPKLENIDPDNIIGAYSFVVDANGNDYVELLNYSQIKKSWTKSTYGFSQKTHGDFAEEMAKRTVIRKSLKMFVNSSNDENLFIEDEEAPEEIVRQDIKAKTTGDVIDIQPAELIDTVEKKVVEEYSEEFAKEQEKEEEFTDPTGEEIFGRK